MTGNGSSKLSASVSPRPQVVMSATVVLELLFTTTAAAATTAPLSTPAPTLSASIWHFNGGSCLARH